MLLCHLIPLHKEAERAELISPNLQVGTQLMRGEVTCLSLQSHVVAALGTGPRCPDPGLRTHDKAVCVKEIRYEEKR